AFGMLAPAGSRIVPVMAPRSFCPGRVRAKSRKHALTQRILIAYSQVSNDIPAILLRETNMAPGVSHLTFDGGLLAGQPVMTMPGKWHSAEISGKISRGSIWMPFLSRVLFLLGATLSLCAQPSPNPISKGEISDLEQKLAANPDD